MEFKISLIQIGRLEFVAMTGMVLGGADYGITWGTGGRHLEISYIV